MPLSITCLHLLNKSTVLILSGVVDYRNAADIRAAITAAVSRDPAPRRLVVDLRGVESIDSLGVGTFVVGHRICRELGIEFALRHPKPVVRRFLGLDAGPPPVTRRPKTRIPRM